jgi:hypothetical protein
MSLVVTLPVGHWVMNSLVRIKTLLWICPQLAGYPGWCAATCGLRSLLLACLLICPLIAPPAAYAVCRSPKNICKHISNCLDRNVDPNNNVVIQIREGVRTHSGRIVRAAADLCAADLGLKREWDKWRLDARTLSTSQSLKQKSNMAQPCAIGIHNRLLHYPRTARLSVGLPPGRAT